MSDLVQHYEKSLPIWLHEDGFSNPILMALHHDGTHDVAVMAVPPQDIFRYAMLKFMTDLTVKEIIFGIDRYTKPGQGTKYKDVLTVFWWSGEYEENHGFRFGVINYRPPPNQIIEPIDWNNTFWNDIMQKILDSHVNHVHKRIAEVSKSNPKLVDNLMDAVTEMKNRQIRGEKLS